MKEQIELALNPLIGLPLWGIGRAYDLEWFEFGKQRQISLSNTQKEKHKIVGDFSLHIQCSWRISDSGNIIVASKDRFYRAGDNPYSNLEEFEWDVQGANRCDELVSQLTQKQIFNLMIVSSIEGDNLGGLKLGFRNGYQLEVFPDISFEAECWRFFRPYSDEEHFIVTGRGITKE